MVIANDSYSEPVALSLRSQNGWRYGKILESLEAQKVAGRDGTSTWQLAPGGCFVAFHARADDSQFFTQQSDFGCQPVNMCFRNVAILNENFSANQHRNSRHADDV